MKGLALGVAVLALAACSGMPARTETGRVSAAGDPLAVAQMLYRQAERCWTQDWWLLGDAVVVESRDDLRGHVIEARRYSPSRGLRLPFVELLVVPADTGAEVVVSEGGEWNLVPRPSVVPTVRAWVSGNEACDGRG